MMDNLQCVEDLEKIIKAHYRLLTKSQKKVAQFVLENLSAVATQSVLQTAQMADVSDATVIRFCSSIGFAGYSDFQSSLRNLFFSGRSLRRLMLSQKGDHNTGVLQKHAEMRKQIIDETCASVAEADFEKAVSMIVQANHIYTAGFRSLYPISYYLAHMLSLYIRKGTALSLDEGYCYEKLTTLSENDLLIGLSFARYTKFTEELLRFGKACGSKIIAITDSPFAPISDLADVNLVVASEAGTVSDSHIGLMFLVETMFSTVIARSSDLVKSNLKFFEENIAPHIFTPG